MSSARFRRNSCNACISNAIDGTPAKPSNPAGSALPTISAFRSDSRFKPTLMAAVDAPFMAPKTNPITKIQATGTGVVARFRYRVKCAK